MCLSAVVVCHLCVCVCVIVELGMVVVVALSQAIEFGKQGHRGDFPSMSVGEYKAGPKSQFGRIANCFISLCSL